MTANIVIRGENIRVTPNLEDFTHEKVSKFERYMPQIEEIFVELAEQQSSRGPNIVSAQITVRHSRGAILRTEEKLDKVDDGSIRSAILAASDKMARRIRRFKEKPRSKRLRERYRINEVELQIAEELPPEVEDAFADVSSADVLEPQVIRRKQVGITAMNEEEAIEQMELLGHTFFMFFNADDNIINVVYKRRNGGYGVLIPQIG